LNEAGEFYGEERLMKLLERTRGLGAAAAAQLILNDVDRFMGEERFSNDLSIIILSRP